MAKIKMLKSTPGAINGGLKVKLYQKGLVYDVEDMMESVVKTFLDIGVAEKHATPPEVERHQKGLTGAPQNKRVAPPETEETETEETETEETETKRPIFTAEELEGAKAKEIRDLAEEHGVDLSGALRNTSAKTLISMYLERQDN